MDEKKIVDTSLPAVQQTPTSATTEIEEVKRRWWHGVKEPGHALQVVIAALLAIGIGMGVSAGVGADNIPEAAPAILNIPGDLWLRSLQCVGKFESPPAKLEKKKVWLTLFLSSVIPMIVCAMILSVQSLRQIVHGGPILARWTVGYYVVTTVLAIGFSLVMMTQIWEPLMTEVDSNSVDGPTDEEVQEQYADRTERKPHDIAVTLFRTLVPNNLVDSFAKNELLGIIVASIVLGYLIRPDENSALLRAVKEINEIIARVLNVLIKLAPIGVFFLILPNIFRLNIRDIGTSLGYLMGAGLSSMMIHLFIILPIIFFAFTRINPYPYWFKCSQAWITVWGTASSAATLPVTLRVCRERGNPNTVVDFAVPLGCVINMDGTAIYLPTVVIFLAKTQGITLDAGQYILILLLSTLAAIGTTPIPSGSLVLMVMIATSVGIPLTRMYAVVIAIDWFMDRFRGVVNVSGDLFAAAILAKVTGIRDPTPEYLGEEGHGQELPVTETYRTNDERV